MAFHVLLMSFGPGFLLWCVPALAFLVPTARADWQVLGAGHVQATVGGGGSQRPTVAPPNGRAWQLSRGTVVSSAVLVPLVMAASLYGLLGDEPYRSLSDATVLGARAQDACSIVVAVLLTALAVRSRPGPAVELVRLGLLGYLTYSYLIYVSGVPMNRAFLAYVAIIAIAGGQLLRGLVSTVTAPATSSPSRRLRVTTGLLLLVTAVLFAALWLSALLPFALGGERPDPEGVGGTPYPVFWLDLAVVLPAIGGVGWMLLRNRPAGPAFGMVALVKIVTLFTALWAGPVVTALSGDAVELGPDAVPSLGLLVACTWLLRRWWLGFAPVSPAS